MKKIYFLLQLIFASVIVQAQEMHVLEQTFENHDEQYLSALSNEDGVVLCVRNINDEGKGVIELRYLDKTLAEERRVVTPFVAEFSVLNEYKVLEYLDNGDVLLIAVTSVNRRNRTVYARVTELGELVWSSDFYLSYDSDLADDFYHIDHSVLGKRLFLLGSTKSPSLHGIIGNQTRTKVLDLDTGSVLSDQIDDREFIRDIINMDAYGFGDRFYVLNCTFIDTLTTTELDEVNELLVFDMNGDLLETKIIDWYELGAVLDQISYDNVENAIVLSPSIYDLDDGKIVYLSEEPLDIVKTIDVPLQGVEYGVLGYILAGKYVLLSWGSDNVFSLDVADLSTGIAEQTILDGPNFDNRFFSQYVHSSNGDISYISNTLNNATVGISSLVYIDMDSALDLVADQEEEDVETEETDETETEIVAEDPFYPNPVSRGDFLNIQHNLSGAGHALLLDHQGRVLLNQVVADFSEFKGIIIPDNTVNLLFVSLISGDKKLNEMIGVE